MMDKDSISTVLVVGYGSMGRRRTRIVREFLPDARFVCVDVDKNRLQQIKEDGYLGVDSIEKGIEMNPQIAFVCTSPGNHALIIIELLESGIHVFTELNLTDDKYDDMARIVEKQGVVLFISSTMLYRRQMIYFNEVVSCQKKSVTYMYHVGQYLPDWHPWESYKDFFVGRRETNGIREILAIQLPWIIQTFGKIRNVTASCCRCTNLDINYPDSVILSIKHENGNIGTFLVDVVSRKTTTSLEVIGEDIHVFWGGHNDDLYSYNLDSKMLDKIVLYDTEQHVEGYSDTITEDPYREEVKAFFKLLSGEKVIYGLKDDGYVLGIINRVEDSCFEHQE